VSIGALRSIWATTTQPRRLGDCNWSSIANSKLE